ncbi:MAG: hypothetical protein D6708_04935 [Candidatus Dadabacteria bacterium]|nr:MAG: hypothetical protein D6708_04935 [Candidatus Dadabacteria bacterium]
MNRFIVLASALVAALVCRASAGEPGWLADQNFTANVAYTSDYVFRGVSQTNSSWAVQGGFDYAAPAGVYLGTWASNVSFGGGVEMDFYGGYAGETAGFSYDLGVVYYAYPKSHDDPELNFVEGSLSLGYGLPALGPVTPSVGLSYAYSSDFFGEDGPAHYLAGSLGLDLPWGLSVSGDLGWQTVAGDKTTGGGAGLDGDDGFDYWHYRVGVAASAKGFDLDLSYHNTTEADFLGSDLADGRIVFTVSRSL